MAGLQDAFDRIGAALEHHLESSHAAGAVAGRHRSRRGARGRRPGHGRRRGRHRGPARNPVPDRLDLEVLLRHHRDAGGRSGALDLHVSVNEILPWLELPEPFGPITLHHLMQHTAGLAIGEEDAPTLAGALWLLRGVPPTTAPGERFWYSNDGWKIVGACLEHVTGMPIHDLLAERLIGPLGLSDTFAAITQEVRADAAVGYGPCSTTVPRIATTRWRPPPGALEHRRRIDRVDRARPCCLRPHRVERRARRAGRPARRRRSRDGSSARRHRRGRLALRLRLGRVDDGTAGDPPQRGDHGLHGVPRDRARRGIAVAIPKNGGGAKRRRTRTRSTPCGGLGGAERRDMPPVEHPPALDHVAAPQDHAGPDAGGERAGLDPQDGLVPRAGPIAVRLERGRRSRMRSSWCTRRSTGSPWSLRGAPARWWGSTVTRGAARHAGPEPVSRWPAHAGFYRSTTRGVVRAVWRGGSCAQWPDDGQGSELTPLDNGSFAVGAERAAPGAVRRPRTACSSHRPQQRLAYRSFEG